MKGIPQLSLEDAFENAPQVRCLQRLFEKDARRLSQFMINVQKTCDRVISAQAELFASLQQFGQVLGSYSDIKFPLDQDEDGSIAQLINHFSSMSTEFASFIDLLTQQCTDCVLYPLNKFAKIELPALENTQEQYKLACTDFDSAAVKYSRLSRKDSERKNFEASEEYAQTRQIMHEAQLRYYMNLNGLQFKRQTHLLEPLVKFFQAWRSVLQMSSEVFNQKKVDETFFTSIEHLKEISDKHQMETEKSAQLMESLAQIKKIQPDLYYPEPRTKTEKHPAHHLQQKQGYLFLKHKSGLMSQWERFYFFTQQGNLMIQRPDDLAGQLLIELRPDLHVQYADDDDRRHVFHLFSASQKKAAVLQASSDQEMEEWTSTMLNIAIGQEAAAATLETGTKTRKKSAPIEIPPSSGSGSASAAQKMEKTSKDSQHRTPTTPPSTPQEFDSLPFPPPIQFDLGDENSEAKVDESLRFEETFEIRFLGCVQVAVDRGERLCQDVCHQVLDTRRAHNFGESPKFRMALNETEILIFDGEKRQIRRRFDLANVAFWTSMGDETPATWALIVREDRPFFRCYVFDAVELKGSEICDALKIATQLAFETALIRQTEAQISAVQYMEPVSESQKTETSNVSPKNPKDPKEDLPTETSNATPKDPKEDPKEDLPTETSNATPKNPKEDLPTETETDAH